MLLIKAAAMAIAPQRFNPSNAYIFHQRIAGIL